MKWGQAPSRRAAREGRIERKHPNIDKKVIDDELLKVGSGARGSLDVDQEPFSSCVDQGKFFISISRAKRANGNRTCSSSLAVSAWVRDG